MLSSNIGRIDRQTPHRPDERVVEDVGYPGPGVYAWGCDSDLGCCPLANSSPVFERPGPVGRHRHPRVSAQ